MPKCEVLRIGHRPERDKRITTHVALTARALGASKIWINKQDSRVLESVSEVTAKFGGEFEIAAASNPKEIVYNWTGKVVHLTMFGLPIDDRIGEIVEENKPLLFIVGAEKVPSWVFEFSDYNIAIGNQPHSEVAALAVALSKIYDNPYTKYFEGGKFRVIPSSKRRSMESL